MWKDSLLSEKCLFAEKGHFQAAVSKFPDKRSRASQGAHLYVEVVTGAKFQTCLSQRTSLPRVSVKQQEKRLGSSYSPNPVCFQGVVAPPEIGFHWALSISFVFARGCLVIILWWTALLQDCLLWSMQNEGDYPFSSSYLFLQIFGYLYIWQTTCRAVWVLRKEDQLPVIRGMKKSITGHIEQSQKSRS